MNLGEKITKATGLEIIPLVKKGKVVGLAKTKGNLEFFTNKVNIDGLTDFHLTVQVGLSEEKKLEIIKEEVDNWKKRK